MKNKYIFLVLLIAMGLQISCEKNFLDSPAVGVINEELLTNKAGIQQLSIGAYTCLNGAFVTGTAVAALPFSCGSTPVQMLFGSIRGGEAYKGSLAGDNITMLEFSKHIISPGNYQVSEPFQFFYNAIYRCNLTLSVMKETTDMTDAEKLKVRAEMLFLRGHYHFMLKRIYGNIPFIDENVVDYKVANTDANGNYVNAWPQIAADFDFARKNLPETQVELGRPNKWAAEAYLARVQIYRANYGEYQNGYQEALAILNNVITNGVTAKGQKYNLVSNYHDIWDCATKNNVESVFAVQHTVNDGTPGATRFENAPNSNQMAVWVGTKAPGSPGEGGINFITPTEWFVDHFRVDLNGLPYLDMYATNSHKMKDDYGLAAAPVAPAVDPFVIDTAAVDPRLDWTVGRRNIPFLGYGTMPGARWFKDQLHGGPYFTKKWHIYKSQVGTFSTVGFPQNAINADIIRFADVLLLAAEVESRIGSLDNARAYVNRVRKRMVDNSGSSKNWVKKNETDGGPNAANYKIGLYPTGGNSDPFRTKEKALEAILYERLLELGLEGHRFFDVMRFGKSDEFNAFINSAKALNRYSYMSDAVYTEIPDALVPIPQVAIDNSMKEGKITLKQNPGY
jgi:starch-binding outer membrane protein, SusD/RagB family